MSKKEQRRWVFIPHKQESIDFHNQVERSGISVVSELHKMELKYIPRLKEFVEKTKKELGLS